MTAAMMKRDMGGAQQALGQTNPAKGSVHMAGLVKSFGNTRAVDHVSADIPAGSYCCILGPSGCGKTTTLRMIAGHETVSAGEVYIDDQNATHAAPAARATSMMFQSYALFPHLRVQDNVSFGMRIQGMGAPARNARALELLNIVEMADFATRYPQQLSGGQQQRVALARALATEPSVLALDEPLSALDPFLRVRVRGELKALQRRLGITFLHVTHSQEEALALADYIMVMNAGRIEQFGTPEEVFHRPRSLFVARFMGAHNELVGSVSGHSEGQISLDLGSDAFAPLPLTGTYTATHGQVSVLIPTQSCSFRAADQAPAQAEAGVRVRVTSVEYGGTGLVLRCHPRVNAGGLSEPLVIHLPLSEIGPNPPEMGMDGVMTWPIKDSFSCKS